MAPGWVDEKTSYTGRQSRIAEVDGNKVLELSVSHKSMLYEMPAAHRHRSGTSPRCSDWLIVDDTENATQFSSQDSSNPDGSLHTVPDRGHKVPTSNAASDDPAIQNEQKDTSQFFTSVDPMSHTLSPNNTTDSPIANFDFPSSPITEIASPPSDMLSPVSPIVKCVYPPSTIVSPATVTRDESSPGSVEHLEEAGGGWMPLFSRPLQSMPEESNDTRSAPSSLKSHLSSLQTVNDSREPSAFTAQQTEDGMPQQSPRSVHRQYQFGELDMPSVYSQPDRLGTYANRQTSIVTGPTMQEMDMGDADSWETNTKESCETPSTTFGRIDSTMIGDVRVDPAWDVETREGKPWKHQEDGKVREQEVNIQQLERSDVGQSTSFSDIQLQSPLDNFIARIASELDSTNPQTYPNDGHRHPAPQNHTRDCATSQALSTKPLPHCFNHNALLVSNSASAPKQLQVEELQELFRVIYNEWMRRMEPLPQLWVPCSELSIPSLFERAVRTLKDFTGGRCALNFEDVFATMNLAFAAAFSLHWQQDFYSWNAFCADALQWQHALSDDEDKVLFLSAMSRWWLHELEPTPPFISSYYTSFGSVTPQGSVYCGDLKTLPEILRNTEVFKVCIGLLDGKSIGYQFKAYCDRSNLSIGFERAVVQKRNDDHPAKGAKSRTWEIQHMIKTITRPLQQRRGIEALRRIVIDTEFQIDRGLLQNTREVEVALLTSGRVSFQRSPFSASCLANNFSVELRIF